MEIQRGAKQPSTAQRQLQPRHVSWAKSDGKFSPRAQLPQFLVFHPRDLCVRQQGCVRRAAAVLPSGSALWYVPFPIGRCSHRHPSSLLGTAISRQIWRFRPRKHKRFLPAGMHPTPMKEITTLPAGLEEGLRFSPSAAVCWLARCLQLKSFFVVVVVVLNCSAWLQKEAFEGMAGEPSCPTCSNF